MPAHAQSTPTDALKPEVRPSGLLVEQFAQAQALGKYLPPELIVEGVQPFSSRVIGATKVIFRPNSRLVFIGNTSGVTLTLLAEELIVEGPAVLTWVDKSTVPGPPPPRGKAPDGLAGRGDGVDGSPGSNGEPGNVGYSGLPGPSVNLYVRRSSGDRLTIDVSGQPGGEGGGGQEGGRGGAGAKGSPASQSAFDCKRGPGRGGNGGPGGDAGPGGPGGTGGDGGNVLLVSADSNVADHISVIAKPGVPGKGGDAGAPGKGGPKGEEGEKALPFCKPANRDGSDGLNGKESPDKTGPSGAKAALPGSFSLVPVSEDQIEAILSGSRP
jgi:hypothetical protein